MRDVVKLTLIPGLIKNNDYECSRVMLIQVKATITKRCAECRAGKLDEWTDAVPLRLSCRGGHFCFTHATGFV